MKVALERTPAPSLDGMSADLVRWYEREGMRFAKMLSGGIEIHQRRLDILVAHRARIVAKQQRLAECLDAVDTKITFYRRSER
jgi:hypothetical protein